VHHWVHIRCVILFKLKPKKSSSNKRSDWNRWRDLQSQIMKRDTIMWRSNSQFRTLEIHVLESLCQNTWKFQPFECNKNWAWTIKKCKRRQFKDRERKTHQAKKATITPEITLPKTMFKTFEACTPNNIWMLKSNLNNTSNRCNLGSKSMGEETTLVNWERMH
jgi:hypothetical protein